MIELNPSGDERKRKSFDAKNLKLALQALREDGFVILHEVIASKHIETLRDRMVADVADILALDNVPFQFNDGHLQQDPPPFPPYLFRDVLVNDFVVQITRAALGEGVKNNVYTGNTCLPNETQQPLHVDHGQLWPGLKTATPAYALVVNVPVGGMTPENGSTEIWPGTHLDTTHSHEDKDIKIAPEDEARRRAEIELLQPHVPAGGVVIRDMRLWHRGMPNHTDTPRPMIAMVHFVQWWQTNNSLLFQKGSESIFEDSPLKTTTKFVEGPIDYISWNKKYDYEKAGRPEEKRVNGKQ